MPACRFIIGARNVGMLATRSHLCYLSRCSKAGLAHAIVGSSFSRSPSMWSMWSRMLSKVLVCEATGLERPSGSCKAVEGLICLITVSRHLRALYGQRPFKGLKDLELL